MDSKCSAIGMDISRDLNALQLYSELSIGDTLQMKFVPCGDCDSMMKMNNVAPGNHFQTCLQIGLICAADKEQVSW